MVCNLPAYILCSNDFNVLCGLVEKTETSALPGLKMLSAAELKEGFYVILGPFYVTGIGNNRLPLKNASSLLEFKA